MIIAGIYSFNKGKEVIEQNFKKELAEIRGFIKSVNSEKYKTKVSKEKTMKGKILYDPTSLNKAFKKRFEESDWKRHKVICQYSDQYYVSDYRPLSRKSKQPPFREMDFVKNQLGIEVQFGKYAFMVYNVCAKMTIFNKMKIIRAGIEIVPIKEFADEMSTGVSYFEQFVWDLEHRGVSDIDIPVLILGLGADKKLEEDNHVSESLFPYISL